MLSKRMFSILKKDGWIISWNKSLSYLWNSELGSDVIYISSNCNDYELIEEVRMFNLLSSNEKVNKVCNKFLSYFIGGND